MRIFFLFSGLRVKLERVGLILLFFRVGIVSLKLGNDGFEVSMYGGWGWGVYGIYFGKLFLRVCIKICVCVFFRK